MKYILLVSILFLSLKGSAQKAYYNELYAQRADSMFVKIWNYYHIKQYPGLFTENYPSGKNVALDYFQGAQVNEKPVSFLWPFSGMFSAANVLIRFPKLKVRYTKFLDTLTHGVLAYRDTSRLPVGYQAYPAKLEKADRYYDDNALVCIDYAESFLNTGDASYIPKAKEVFSFITTGWDEKLGGGVYWLEGHKDQKPACSNGMATLAALKLYQCTNDTLYLNWGKRFYQWMFMHLRNKEGIYYNDIKMDGKTNPTYYTYNTGSMLEASVLLYNITKQKNYLDEAHLVAKNAYNFFTVSKGKKDLQFQIDLPWFVTVLFRGYESLYHIDHNPEYLKTITKDLDRAWVTSKDKYGLIAAKWATDDAAKKKPKWLLDQGCIAELYARISLLNIKND
ncbi:glycoside hydrolase family 76 protein [Pedobacter sandarakinus]|uniref:glycoside hydrolase family 76 protein n=1 Tax=Pedobacter sandarakinus TaxID=353156 RepID=UPI002247E737|nr:glycoside hydrolase family 76 protein [Pedobacter sandarakinus]MCX2574160.1 AGE family epimerase/isomerase [Pedobacter sandarakinus]